MKYKLTVTAIWGNITLMVGKVQERMQACIAEVKRIWKPGMSSAQIAEAVDAKIFVTRGSTAKQPSRNTIIGMFVRHKEALLPCTLIGRHAKKAPITHKKEALRKKVDSISRQPEKSREAAQQALKAVEQKAAREPLTAAERQVRRFDLDRLQFSREPVLKAQKTASKSNISLATFSWDKENVEE